MVITITMPLSKVLLKPNDLFKKTQINIRE